MGVKGSEMSEKLSERSEMSDVAFASSLVRGVVPASAGDTIGARIRAAAQRLGWPHSRTRDVWYQQARRIDAREMDQLRTARREVKEADHGIQELRARLARLEAFLAVADEDFHQPAIEDVRRSLRELGGVVDRARDGGEPR